MVAELAVPDEMDEHDREVLVLLMRLGRVLGAIDLKLAREAAAAVEHRHAQAAGLDRPADCSSDDGRGLRPRLSNMPARMLFFESETLTGWLG